MQKNLKKGKEKIKPRGHRDIQSPCGDKGTPAEDTIRPIRNDKFTNKMRLLLQFLCGSCQGR